MDVDFDSNGSSDYSLLGRMYKSRSVPGSSCADSAGCGANSCGGQETAHHHYLAPDCPAWDSGVGSDCFPGLEAEV